MSDKKNIKCDHIIMTKTNGDTEEYGSMPCERVDINIEGGTFTIGRGKDVVFKGFLREYQKIEYFRGETVTTIAQQNNKIIKG